MSIPHAVMQRNRSSTVRLSMSSVLVNVLLAVFAFGGSLAMAQQDRPADVAAYLDRCEAFGWSGAVLVVHEGEVLCNMGFGHANRELGLPNGPETLFEIASLTKIITACAVMSLVEEGKVGLDDSIAAHLPGVPEDKRGITIRHLLTHTSGMPRFGPGGGGDDLELAVGGYLSGPPSSSPGEQSEYWNGGYALLAGIIERVSGETYQRFCERRVFEPAGITRSGFTGQAFEAHSLATGYNGLIAERTAADHPYASYGWHYKGMGGMVTSLNDLHQFVNAYESGKLLQDETVQQMETPADGWYGFGWAITQTDRGTQRIGHGGDVQGFHCYLLRFPDEDTLIVVLSNTDDVPVWKIAWNIESLVFDQPMRTPPPPSFDHKIDFSNLVGEYESVDGSRLVVHPIGSSLRIGAVGVDAMSAVEPESSGKGASTALALASSILDAVIASNPEEILDHLAPGIPRSWSSTLCTHIWPAHVREHGKFQSVETLGARMIDTDSYEVLFALDHERSPAQLQVIITNGKLQIFDLKGPGIFADKPFAWIGENMLASFDWSADKITARVRVKHDDSGISLEAEKDGGELLVFTRMVQESTDSLDNED
tara:strand:- start:249011 stop:250801 length:1791 start_codon:yes stop_codon:yes gene_type:complete